jgi:predicted porin
MNKKLLAAAVAAAVVAAPAAFAESTVYGKMHTSVDMLDYDGYSANGYDDWEMNSRASRLGFKGSEDLGNGLKAIYQIELQVNSGGGSQGQGSTSFLGKSSRNTFIGLAGDWGTFLVGRHDTPAKMAFYASGNERLGDSVIDLNLGNNLNGTSSKNQPIGVFHEYRADNAIAYVTPNFSGFTAAVAIIPGEDSDVNGSRDGIADHYSLGLMYKGNGLKVGAGYSSYDLDGPGAVDADDWEVMNIGASYTMNAFSFGAHYEKADNQPPGLTGVGGGNKDNDYDAWAVTGKYTFANNAVSAVYTDSDFTTAANGDGELSRGGWGFAAEHNFSKRTKVYAAYASGEDDYSNSPNSDEDNDVFSLGMIHNF